MAHTIWELAKSHSLLLKIESWTGLSAARSVGPKSNKSVKTTYDTEISKRPKVRPKKILQEKKFSTNSEELASRTD